MLQAVMFSVLAFIALIGWVLPGQKTVTSYSLNDAVTASSPIAVVTLPAMAGVNNCTGVTSTMITVKGPSGNVTVQGMYSVDSLNQTGWLMQMIIEHGSASAPSQVFGSGDCATPTGLSPRVNIYLPIITSGVNTFVQTFSFTISGLTIGTGYWFWIVLQSRGVNSGHINMRQQGAAQCFITVIELR